LYVGNLDFKVDAEDLLQSINLLIKKGTGIRLETTTVPRREGGNRGYGFIKLSWHNDAPIDPEDICTRLSGMAKVNSRQVYLCKTNDTSTASSVASDYSESDNDTSTASSVATDRSESDNDTSAVSESIANDTSESEPDEPIRGYLTATRNQEVPQRYKSIQYRIGYDSDGDSLC
jgi:hypothetical protein